MDGILLVDKPSGPTSFDVVRAVRASLRIRRVGHAGTLDPLASGLIVVCLGKGTRLVPYLMEGRKRYSAEVTLGASTDTDDALGRIIETAEVPELSAAQVEEACARFIGKISQVPPVFSAIKRDGEALYRKARRGEAVTPEPREVEIFEIAVPAAAGNKINLEVTCGKGTYIRSLARDLAREMGTAGHLSALRRTASSGFLVDEAIPLDQVATSIPGERIVPIGQALAHMPTAVISDADLDRVSDGRTVDVEPYLDSLGEPKGPVRLLTRARTLAAIGHVEGGRVVMERVFVAREP